MAEDTLRRPRELALRRWMLLAHTMRWASIGAMVAVIVAVGLDWLPSHWANAEYLLLIALPLLGLCLFSAVMAERRTGAMMKAWGRARARRRGLAD